MDNYTKDFVTLLDEEGNEHSFELLDIVEYEGESFFALLPKKNLHNSNFDDDVCGYYIFKEISNNDEHILVEVEDPVKLEKISNLLEKRLSDTEYEFS